MSTRADLTNLRFGTLFVIEFISKNDNGDALWKCVCDCGEKLLFRKRDVEKGSHKGCPKRIKDWSNHKIGKITVQGRADDLINIRGGPIIQWKCVCECGKIVYRSTSHLKRGKCVCKECKANEEKSKFGFMGIRQHHWTTIQRQAKLRNLQFNITPEYAWGLYEKQNRKCALSGIQLNFATTKKEHATGVTTASLDRIDSSKGYIEGNVQWLHKWINIMKSDFDQKEFLDICKRIIEHANSSSH